MAFKDTPGIQRLIADYEAIDLKLPEPNPLIPQYFAIKSSRDALVKNLEEPILLKKEHGLEVWLHQDHVFKMPRVVVHLVFIVPGLFASPKLRSFFSVYTDCLIEKITAEIGYEAILSDMAYSIKSFENLGFKVKFSGYNDKIVTFIKIFFEIMY